jgi:hypothetical protein
MGRVQWVVRLWVVVLVFMSSRAWAADEVAILVVNAPTAGPATVTLLNRELPAGTPVKVQVPVPGADPTSGSMVVWPNPHHGLCGEAPRGGHQRHEIGLTTTGTGESRVLEGTIPPLQLAMQYCIVVHFDRRLSTELLASLAEVVSTTSVPWPNLCVGADRDSALATVISNAIQTELHHYPDAVLAQVRIDQAARTIVGLFHLDNHCTKLLEADATNQAAGNAVANVAARMASTLGSACFPPATTSCTKLPSTAATWPAAVSKVGNDFQTGTLADALDGPNLQTIGAALAQSDTALGAELQKFAGQSPFRVANLPGEKAKLGSRPAPPERPVSIFLPDGARYFSAEEIYADPRPLLKNLHASRSTLVAQLQLMRANDPPAIDRWLKFANQMGDLDVESANDLQLEASTRTSRDAVITSMTTDLKAVMQTDVIKDQLRLTASDGVAESTSKAPSTDEKGSWISPTVGVLVAAPGSSHGVMSGWIQPYVGASIYFTRVDRVIDLDELVGDTFWQRNSFSVGVLASKPSVNGKDIGGPWSTSVVPMVGFGHRFTQYFRVDVGVIPFKFADANPVIATTHWGLAGWAGVTLDADVWALVSGKVK